MSLNGKLKESLCDIILLGHNQKGLLGRLEHRPPKRKIRDFSVSAYKVVLCYNGLKLNYKGLYGKTMDLFSMVEIIVV